MEYICFSCKAIIKISQVKGSETPSVGVPLSPSALLGGWGVLNGVLILARMAQASRGDCEE
ncbi:hypothetical protein ES703_108783 [subsurface metagenome]